MAETFTLSVSKKNRQASDIIYELKSSGINISDIFCEFVIRYDKELLSLQKAGAPAQQSGKGGVS